MAEYIDYICSLTPLGEYFLGGEKTFEWENGKGNNIRRGKSPYFIRSQIIPGQATVLGALRYLVLKKNGMLNRKPDETVNLIGEKGFNISNPDDNRSYGKIESLGPVYISDGKNSYFAVPLNHKSGNERYEPFNMTGPVFSSLGEKTYLPSDYVAKQGTAEGFLRAEDLYIANNDEIFRTSVRTRTNTSQAEKAMFKKEYVILNAGLRFKFSVKAEKDSLPKKETVYIGQEKSAFLFEAAEGKPELPPINAAQKVPENEVSVYYLVSDAFLQNPEEYCVFWCAEEEQIRTIANNRWSNAVRSELKKLYRRGSVFYVDKGKAQAFEEMAEKSAMRKTGYNCCIRLGGK